MPHPTARIAHPQKEALLACYQACTRLVPLDWRPEFILIGAAASIVHGSELKTEDVDIAASPRAIHRFEETVRGGAQRFRKGSDGNTEFDSDQGFPVKIEILHLDGQFVDSVHVIEPCSLGFVASVPDLFCLRAVTVLGRGDPGDVADFKWLLESMMRGDGLLPSMSSERLAEVVAGAGAVGGVERLMVFLLLPRELWEAFLRLI
ncbi:hypothetical protein BCR34DRAFT_501500 [Clohesyomyces aquaticus]|uniref:Uncharacterized protein n=1 Tax=Clohesyomyces aquaticus TaxID=1231657 RepID=A0A1Y1Y014_9PLEO|nr:hypothetical protein BCR34DRAFT_501500 [Clohesyomyces aquaticus]